MNEDLIIIITTILLPHLSSSVLHYNIINTEGEVLSLRLTQDQAREDGVDQIAAIDNIW